MHILTLNLLLINNFAVKFALQETINLHSRKKLGSSDQIICHLKQENFMLKLKCCKKKNNRIKNSYQQLKNRLKTAESFAKKNNIEQFSTHLNSTTLQFFKSQMKCQKKKGSREKI